MNKIQLIHFETLKRVKDSVHVQVAGGNVDKALKDLRQRVMESGILRELNDRRKHPRPQDRRKLKATRAAALRARRARR